MISFPEDVNPRLWWLANTMCEGTISDHELRELELLLEADPKGREFYIDFLKINAEISWLISAKQHSTMDLGPRLSLESIVPNPNRSPILGFLGDWANFFNQHSPLSFIMLFAIFGVAILATWLLSSASHHGNAPEELEFIAQITVAKDCQWSSTAPLLAEKAQLQAGQKLPLEKGVAQITYSNGAEVLIEGPASYTVDSPKSGILDRGKLTARADTERSRQFTILTPNARFVDLGTEFGVRVDDEGHCEVAVFAGKVNAEAKLSNSQWDTPVALSEGEAAVCEGRKFTPFVAQRSSFPSLQPLPPPPPVFQRWLDASRELQGRADLLAYYDFQVDRSNPSVLFNRAPTGAALNGEIQNASWVEGRFPGKSGLEFKAADAGVRVNLPGKYERLTLIAWVSSKGLANKYNGILLSDGWRRPGELHWQVRSSGQVEVDVCGQTVSQESYCSTQSIPADSLERWCMIAAVIEAPDQCSLYINGEYFETLKSKKIPAAEIGTAMIGGWNKGDSTDGDFIRSLSGRMDELMIFKKALTADEIKRMFENGNPGVSPLSEQPSPSYTRWLDASRELQGRADLLAYYDFQVDRSNPSVLFNRAPTGAALNGEIQNASWVEGRFPGKSGLEFKAADAGVRVNLPDKYERLTFITWVNINQFANKVNGLLLSNDWSRPGQLHCEIYADGRVAINVLDKNSNKEVFYSAPTILDDSLNHWCMISGIVDTVTKHCFMYLNDKCILSQACSSHIAPIQIGSATIAGWLERGNDTSLDKIRNLTCRMDEMLIFQTALTADEIKQVYEAGKP